MKSSTWRDFGVGVALGLVILGGCLGLVIGILAIIDVANIAHANCAGISELRNTLVTLVQHSTRTLPTLTYYKQHPAELAQALQQARQEIAALQAVSCH